jgi:predicted regulator of Ras-like GTPase activity (Roadblock/LC7/MglB family)
MATAYKNLQMLIESIMVSSKGWVEAVAVVTQDGSPLTYSAEVEFKPDFIAAITATICGACDAATDILNLNPGGYESIDIQLGDKRHIIINRYGDYYVVCLTRPNPNLGFINLVLRALLSKSHEGV